MAEFAQVASADELKEGGMKMAMVGGNEVLLARVGDKYYAAENRCPHMGGNLSQGKLEGTIITCPRHASQFDLVDGHIVRWTDWTGLKAAVAKKVKSPRPLKTYEVKVEQGKVLVTTAEEVPTGAR